MSSIPTEEDWGNYKQDLDANYAYGVYFGKSNDEMKPEYKDSVLSRVEDIAWMPKKPFQYYIFGLRNFVIEQDFGFFESSDAASCFLDLVLSKLEKQPDYILPVLSSLMSDLEFIGNNQSLYDADIDIYGDFKDKLKDIKKYVDKSA